MIRHTPPKPIPTPNWNAISEIIPPEETFYDFNQAIETIIKFIDKDLNDIKTPEHLKTDIRALRATFTVLSANYPFTKDPNNADTIERKFRREIALTNIIKQMLTIVEDNAHGKFDQKRK